MGKTLAVLAIWLIMSLPVAVLTGRSLKHPKR